MSRPVPGLLVVVVLSPLSLVLAHNLAFLVAYGAGAGAALRATGHDGAWLTAVWIVVIGSAALGAAGALRLASLCRTARRAERVSGVRARIDRRGFATMLLRTWIAVAAVTAAWFVVQEHVERLSVGEAAPLLGPLFEGGAAGPLTVIPLVALAVALVGTLFRWSASMLLARIAEARRRLPRVRSAGPRPRGRFAYPAAELARSLGLRAPPRRLSA